jgi:hypothetical protein
MPPEPSLLAGADDPEQPPGYPFRGPGLLVRALPFAAIAVLAEASLALSSGPIPASALAVSLVLLLAVAAAFALPWQRLPRWLSVLMPLAYRIGTSADPGRRCHLRGRHRHLGTADLDSPVPPQVGVRLHRGGDRRRRGDHLA